MFHSEKLEVLCCKEKEQSENFTSKYSFHIDAILSKSSNQCCVANQKEKKDWTLFTDLRNENSIDFFHKICKKPKTTRDLKYLCLKNNILDESVVQDQTPPAKYSDCNNESKFLEKLTNDIVESPKNIQKSNDSGDSQKKNLHTFHQTCGCDTKSSFFKNLQSTFSSKDSIDLSLDDEKIKLPFEQKTNWKFESNFLSYPQNLNNVSQNFIYSSKKSRALPSIHEKCQLNELHTYYSQQQISSLQLGWLTEARFISPKVLNNELGKHKFKTDLFLFFPLSRSS